MSPSQTLITIGGIITLLFALQHTQFEKQFGWKKLLKDFDQRNRQIIYGTNFFLALFIFGALSIVMQKLFLIPPALPPGSS